MTNTDQSFNHLDVMNSVLGLAYNLKSYPNHLYQTGYKIIRIEQRIHTDKNKGPIRPDILFMNQDYGLFAECKSGEYYTGNNIAEYSKITLRNLVEKGIDIKNELLMIDVGIFGKDNMEELSKRLISENIRYPQVAITGEIEKRGGDAFKDPNLERIFNTPMVISGKAPRIIKFCEDSGDSDFAPDILNCLMARVICHQLSFTTREITSEAIGEMWDVMDGHFQTNLCTKVGKLLRYFKQHTSLKENLYKNDEQWRIEVKLHWKSQKRFSENCTKAMNGLGQTTLYDF